ncbi:hypothetical protein ABZ468_30660 [Streptomyces sp. NPDC005708]|uniref:hypothetical protein n=1 Tax=Streptomyces sp. NPDC005708 TaxID=3154564 RepID=UPI0033C2FAC5
MLRFMDWSVVALGCLLVLGSLGSRWWERIMVSKGHSPDQGIRFFWTWFPLLMGLGMIGAKVPGLLHAPHLVVELIGALNFALTITVLFFALRSGRRIFRRRGTV